MIRGVVIRSTIISLVAFVAAGCGTSSQPHFYNLDSVAIANGAPASNLSIMVVSVTVPATVDRPQFVVQVAPNRVEIEEFDRWAAPLDEAIARVVASDLSILLASPNVVTAPLTDFNPQYQLSINVQRFESVKDESTMLDAVWTMRSLATGMTRSGRTIARERVQGQGFDALAAAHSRAVEQLSSDIAAVILTGANRNS